MLIDRSVLDLIHLVELALEEDELLAGLRLGVDDTLLVLLKSIDDFHEVALGHKEFEVLGLALLSDRFNGNEKCVLVKVILKGAGLVVLKLDDASASSNDFADVSGHFALDERAL